MIFSDQRSSQEVCKDVTDYEGAILIPVDLPSHGT